MNNSSPTSTLTSLDFKPEKPHHFVHIISNLLTPSECEAIITSHKNLIPSNVTPETIRTREVFDDSALASKLWSRIRGFYENDAATGTVYDEDGDVWVVSGLNERFRLCLYEKGSCLAPGRDKILTRNRRQILPPHRRSASCVPRLAILHDAQYVPQHSPRPSSRRNALLVVDALHASHRASALTAHARLGSAFPRRSVARWPRAAGW